MSDLETAGALVVGAGPAGLMAAETLSQAGRTVLIAEAKPSPARKFLMAGKSGLNMTKDEPTPRFLEAYAESAEWLAPMIAAFGPQQVRDWMGGLGRRAFTGSTGRVFPTEMKASPLLRAWLGRLEAQDAQLRRRWRWRGWDAAGDAMFDTPFGARRVRARATVLALGGASWARLGSDGAWAETLAKAGVALDPFTPSNVGLRIAWSAHMEKHFGAPVKGAALHDGWRAHRGEFVISRRGLEGGGVYALGPALRAGRPVTLDLVPDLSRERVAERLQAARPGLSTSNLLRRALGLDPARIALLREFGGPIAAPRALAERIKALPLRHDGPRPLDEAISTAGGVRRDALDAQLMLRARPGVFCAGEMLGWDAPTGGYLLTACLATGLWAGRGAEAWLAQA